MAHRVWCSELAELDLHWHEHLQGLGAKVKVGVRREEHFARAHEMGFEPFYIHGITAASG